MSDNAVNYNNLLLAQPIELLEEICSHIDRPKELLHLALSSKYLYEIIVPRHLDFRDIRCDPQRKGLWEALVAQPHLAKSVRRLELVFEVERQRDGVIIPRWFRGISEYLPLKHHRPVSTPKEFEDGCLLALAEALKLMSSLTRFCWSRGDNPSVLLAHVFRSLRDTVLGLEELQIVNNDSFFSSVDFQQISSPLWNISTVSLVSISIHLSSSVELNSWFGHTMIDFLLTHCPILQRLYINTTSNWEITQFLEDSHWSFLESLAVGRRVMLYPPGLSKAQHFTLLQEFFMRHSKLRCLSIGDSSFFTNGLSYENPKELILSKFCSNLTAIALDHDVTAISDPLRSIMSLQVAQNLTYFEGAISTRGLDVLETMKNLKAGKFSLRSTSLLKFTQTAPDTLERLHVQPAVHPDAPTSTADYKIIHLVKYLTRLTSLTHLGGFLTRVDLHNPASRPILKPLKGLSRLKFIQISIGNRVSWVELVRDHEGRCVGYKEVDKGREKAVSCWGDIFRGLDVIY